MPFSRRIFSKDGFQERFNTENTKVTEQKCGGLINLDT
jgi:hypothetical protein